MQKNSFLITFIAVAIVLSLTLLGSLYWGQWATKSNHGEVFLLRFDKEIAVGEQACFTAKIQSNYDLPTIAAYSVIANDKVLGKGEVDLAQEQELGKCIASEDLSRGDNKVEILIGVHRLFYHVVLKENVERTTPTISVTQLENDTINIKVENNDALSYEPLEIFVNDKLDHRVYFSGENFESDERISLADGGNKVSVQFEGAEQTLTVSKERGFAMNPFLGILIVSALLCVLAFFVFPKQDLLEKLSYSILSFFTILMVVFFGLELGNALSAFNFLLIVSIITLVLALAFRKNFENKCPLGKKSLRDYLKVSPLLLLLLFILIFSSFFFNMFTTSYYSSWTVFYERQSQTIMTQEEVPFTDSFSFLGTKPFGYMSGYFFINPGVSWLTGLDTQQAYAIIMILAQIAFIASALLFFRSYGFGDKRSYLALIALFLGSFMFADFSFNIRHVISYSFLFTSLFLLRKEKPLHSGIALGLGTFVQTPVLGMFIVALPIVLTKMQTIKTSVKALTVGIAVALVLFLPTLMRYGLPNQAQYNVWGYLWSIPIYGFFLDYLPLVALIALYIVPFILTKEIKVDKFAIRVGLFLTLFIAIQLFVSYRINVIATTAFALFIGLLFPKRLLENRLAEYSIGMLFAVTFALMFLITISFYPVVPAAQSSFKYISENTSTNANFLNEPYLGHQFIHLTQRKSSADLAVEYANEEMILDSFEFIKTENPAILDKYDIDYVVNRSIFLDEKPVGNNLWHETIEFEELDKIYANGLFFVHTVNKK
ncbi:MAG: hypothetical protein CL943_03920 [Candidatus Diapherotrites archaeon]|uniref:Uncharacterized protein n=1 Tax=Candidatus Iainarchaeum sp. TaxID=3101447 RepID=A0A2D6M1Z7_9ARCH|nr:hypothetical protein [Candidatus Diapherotrites archaeon]|tara:strand:+ start:447 stop:2759 length:2313 start_codon:yes stop_codon:yes gene_type:complete